MQAGSVVPMSLHTVPLVSHRRVRSIPAANLVLAQLPWDQGCPEAGTARWERGPRLLVHTPHSSSLPVRADFTYRIH